MDWCQCLPLTTARNAAIPDVEWVLLGRARIPRVGTIRSIARERGTVSMALLVAMVVLGAVSVGITVAERRYKGPTRRWADLTLRKRFAIGFGECAPSVVIGAAVTRLPSSVSDGDWLIVGTLTGAALLAACVLAFTVRYALQQTRRWTGPDEGARPW